SGSRRKSATPPRTIQLTSRRASASDPGESATPAARIPTKAEPHRLTVNRPAPSAATSGREGAAAGAADSTWAIVPKTHYPAPWLQERGRILRPGLARGRKGFLVRAAKRRPERSPS